MLKSKIHNLKDIGAEFLLENKCPSYAEGVMSACDVFNSIVEAEDAEIQILKRLVRSYSNKDKAPNNNTTLFDKGIIDFYEYVLNYEDLQNENEKLKEQVDLLKEKINFWENRYKTLEDQYRSIKRFFLKNKE